MITRKELSFVNSWPKSVPYPGIDYCEEALQKLRNCLKLYQEDYANRKYSISFSNNEEIEFQVLQMNVCHMLGVDYKNLMDPYFNVFRKDILGLDPISYTNSYIILTSILENMDRVLDFDKKYAKALNYYKISIKCDIFKKLADLGAFNYGCLNFDRDIFVEKNPDIKFNSNSTKFLYTPSDEIISPYFMMGLKISEGKTPESEETEEEENKDLNTSKKYIVETLIAPENIASFFNNQEVIIPTQILIDINGELNKKEATAEEKIKLLKEYQSIVNQYRIDNKINIYNDYISLLLASREQKNPIKRVIEK